MKLSTGRKYFLVFLLAFMFSVAYLLPYIKYVFNDALVQGLGITNKQAGLLLTVYSIMNTITLIPGGMLSDKYKTKNIIVLSAIGTGLCNLLLVFSMNYKTAVVVWGLLGFTTIFAFWGSVIKAVRLLGDEHEQGRLYGFYAGFQGVVNTVVAIIAAFIFAQFADQQMGLKGILLLYGAFNIVGAILFWFLFPSDLDSSESSNEDPVRFKDIFVVLKMPETWLLSLIIFSIYGLFSGSTTMTSYVSDVLLITGVVGTMIAIFRTYLARAIFAPVGGIVADKTKKPVKNIQISSLVSAALLFILLLFGNKLGSIGVLFIILASSITIYMNFGVMWATAEELRIPRRLYGTVIGVASIIGYAPDLFMHTMFGNWIDQYGNTGYTYIFMFLIFLCFVGVVTSAVISRRSIRRVEAK